MRAHVFAGAVLSTTIGFVAVALAQSTPPFEVPIPTPRPIAIDAGSPELTADAAPSLDAGAPDAAPPEPALIVPAPVVTPSSTESPDAGYEPSNVGLSVGLRGGYSIPIGAGNGGPLSGVVSGVIPIGVDVGWFFNPHLYVGGYFLYGFATSVEPNNDTCGDPDETCSATVLRFGVAARWHFHPEARLDPWVGAGLGYDIINLEAEDESAGTLDESGSLHGFDLTLETGVDYKPLPYVGIGPYVELATGHYSADVSSTSFHEWLTFGLRLRTNL